MKNINLERRKLLSFDYDFQSGPISEFELAIQQSKGNCRLAIQDFLALVCERYFSENELLNPNAYDNTGRLLRGEFPAPDPFDGLGLGTVLYAERIKNRAGESINLTPDAFSTRDDYVIRLHSAIYIPKLTHKVSEFLPIDTNELIGFPVIWHATSISGGTCLWTAEKFLDYYKPIAAKCFI